MPRPLKLVIATIFLVPLVLNVPVLAQNLDSTNYTLLDPSIASTIAGSTDSTNYSQLYDAQVSAFTSTSATYQIQGGQNLFIEPSVPKVLCFETNTNNGSTTCTGLPGSNGMHGVCSAIGCYDRAKLEIDPQNNPADTRYAIQISTSSDFSTGVSFVDATTRLLKSGLTIADFIPECEWEGTTSAGICGAPNTTWQRYNILGLTPDTVYYTRLSAQKGTATLAQFSQTAWSPSEDAATSTPTISLDIDINSDATTNTAPPYSISLGTLTPGSVTTSTNMIVWEESTNALSGIVNQVKGLNGGLKNVSTVDTISSVNGDLAAASSGYGLRNNSSFNTASDTGTIGNITVSSSPSDFTDAGATHKVGQVPTSFVNLFTSGGAPLSAGRAGFLIKAKPSVAIPVGNYSETITLLTYATF